MALTFVHVVMHGGSQFWSGMILIKIARALVQDVDTTFTTADTCWELSCSTRPPTSVWPGTGGVSFSVIFLAISGLHQQLGRPIGLCSPPRKPDVDYRNPLDLRLGCRLASSVDRNDRESAAGASDRATAGGDELEF